MTLFNRLSHYGSKLRILNFTLVILTQGHLPISVRKQKKNLQLLTNFFLLIYQGEKHQYFYIEPRKSLVEGLKSGKVLGACLDVLEYEPSDFSSFFTNQLPEELCFLFQQQNVLFSPHVAGWTHESYYKLSAVLADKIEQTFHR